MGLFGFGKKEAPVDTKGKLKWPASARAQREAEKASKEQH